MEVKFCEVVKPERRCCSSATWATGVQPRTGSPGNDCEDTCASSYRAWTWPDLPHRAQHDGAVSDRGRISLCRSPLALQR